MLNPYVILGIVLFWGFSMAGAYLKGSQVAQDAARAQYAESLEQTIAQHNKNAVIDMQAAAKVAADEATARTRTAMLRSRTNEVIRANPSPVTCAWPADRFGLLVTAVQEANGDSADASGRLSTAIGKANAPAK